jgi:hypothetical protein
VKRNPERGNTVVLALIVLSALGTLGMLSIIGIRSSSQTTANDRFHSIALYAAESGGAAAMEYLRANLDPNTGWTSLLSPGAIDDVAGNNVAHGASGNPFSSDIKASYMVEIFNNRNDTGYSSGTDTDKRVIIRSTGYGPDRAVAVIEWEVQSSASTVERPCPTYGQKGMSEDNAGRNDCLGTIDTSQTATFTP